MDIEIEQMGMTITEKILAKAAGRKNQISKIKMQNCGGPSGSVLIRFLGSAAPNSE